MYFPYNKDIQVYFKKLTNGSELYTYHASNWIRDLVVLPDPQEGGSELNVLDLNSLY